MEDSHAKDVHEVQELATLFVVNESNTLHSSI